MKAGVGLRRVLEDYGILAGLRRSGKQHYRGSCPIHRGEGRDTFHADLEKNAFHCFSCGAGGNVLDLAAHLEPCSLREAALRLQRRHLTTGSAVRPPREQPAGEQLVTKKREANAVLSFRLSGLDPVHPYVSGRGLSRETAVRFGMGYYGGPGVMRERVVMPIHDEQARLVAYCGRSVTGQDPRYKFPAAFRKSAALFNYHRAAALLDDGVLVVEGFFDCMRVHQAGFASVVALMGAALSGEQENLLVQRFRRVTLMLDGDAAGRTASCAAAQRLASRCSVNQVMLAPGRQPDEMSNDEIRRVLG